MASNPNKRHSASGIIITERTPLFASPSSESQPGGRQRRRRFSYDARDAAAAIALDEKANDSRAETIVLVKLALPSLATLLLEVSLFSTTVIAVGRLGTKPLAAASLSSLTANVVCFSMVQGMVSSLDTLCTQAVTSPNPKSSSLHAQRTAFLLTLMLIPQFIIFWNAEPVLLLLHQDPEVAQLATLYLRILMTALPAFSYFEVIRRWLQAQGLVQVPTYILGVVAPINIALNYFFVWSKGVFGMGFIGAPIAASISTNLMFLGGMIYCVFWCPKDTWGGWTTEAFRNLGECFRLGVAGVAMTASEWWAFEILGFASSWISAEALAANSVLSTAQFIFYQPALAISIAASVRLGNILGANRPEQAQLVARISMSMGFAVGAFNMIFLALNRGWIGKLFTSDPAVLKMVERVLPVVALYQLADSTAGAAYGTMRGAGRSSTAAYIVAVSYWLLGVPFALVLTFRFKMELVGLWGGLTLGLITVSSGMGYYILYHLDFQAAADKALQRAEEEEECLAALPQ